MSVPSRSATTAPRAGGEYEIVAVHGWGFDSTSWRDWPSLLYEATPPGTEIRFAAYDRGYFGSPQAVRWQPRRAPTRILFVHSMGLMFCDRQLLEGADIAVLFGCFRHFHPEEPDERGRSRRALAGMRRRLEEDPAGVLAAFYRKCDLPRHLHPTPSGAPVLPLLRDDLERLDTEHVPLEAMAEVPAIHLLHGAGDRIVPEALGAALAGALGARARYAPVPGGGHALPFAQAGECLRRIASQVSTAVNSKDDRPDDRNREAS